jgi:signal transduction histidine kinase
LQVMRHSALGFALVVVAVGLFILMSERAYVNSADALREINSIGQANVALQQTISELREAENHMIRYLKDGDVSSKTSFEVSREKVKDSLGTFENYAKGISTTSLLLVRTNQVVDTQLSQMSKSVNAKLVGESAVDQAPFQMSMIGLRQIRLDWVNAQADYIYDRQSSLGKSLGAIRAGVMALGLISLLVLFYYIRQSRELEAQQLNKKEALKADRDRLEVEVARRTFQLTELTQHLQSAIEDERSRLARNLHDDLGALLTSAKLDAARIKARLQEESSEAKELLSHLVETLNSSISLGRKIIENLRPSALANLGLLAALEILIDEFVATSGVRANRELEAIEVDLETELVVFRIVQEALTNVSRYAKAKEVWIKVSMKSGVAEIRIHDDGIGFDSIVIPKSAYGLLGMRFRVETHGGSLSVVSELGKGATITAVLPPSLTPIADRFSPTES